jgi:hypothetical protein
LDPAPIEHQIVEAEAELFISGVFDRRPTGPPSFLENRLNTKGYSGFARVQIGTPIYSDIT